MKSIQEPFQPGSFAWAYSALGYQMPPGLEVGTLVKITKIAASEVSKGDLCLADVITADGREFKRLMGCMLELRRKYQFPGDRRMYPEKHPRVQKQLFYEVTLAEDAADRASKKLEYLKWVAFRSRSETLVIRLEDIGAGDDEQDVPL